MASVDTGIRLVAHSALYYGTVLGDRSYFLPFDNGSTWCPRTGAQGTWDRMPNPATPGKNFPPKYQSAKKLERGSRDLFVVTQNGTAKKSLARTLTRALTGPLGELLAGGYTNTRILSCIATGAAYFLLRGKFGQTCICLRTPVCSRPPRGGFFVDGLIVNTSPQRRNERTPTWLFVFSASLICHDKLSLSLFRSPCSLSPFSPSPKETRSGRSLTDTAQPRLW